MRANDTGPLQSSISGSNLSQAPAYRGSTWPAFKASRASLSQVPKPSWAQACNGNREENMIDDELAPMACHWFSKYLGSRAPQSSVLARRHGPRRIQLPRVRPLCFARLEELSIILCPLSCHAPGILDSPVLSIMLHTTLRHVSHVTQSKFPHTGFCKTWDFFLNLNLQRRIFGQLREDQQRRGGPRAQTLKFLLCFLGLEHFD